MLEEIIKNCFIPATLAMAITITIIACCLLALKIPADPKLKKYRFARQFLAGAYITLTFFVVLRLFYEDGIQGTTMVTTSTLIISFFQAFLFTYAMITLIDYRFMTKRRLRTQTMYLVLVSVFIFMGEVLPKSMYYPILYTGSILYASFLIYYVLLFEREYKKYRSRMDNFYSDDEQKRLHWIRSVFYLALVIGIFAFLVVFGNQVQYNIFIITCTLFYAYAGIRYINYVNVFHYISEAVANDDEQENSLPATEDNDLGSKINQWIGNRKYINSCTLDSLAADLYTNRTYLSRYINTTMDCNFKTWISSLRIEDAKKLLIETPEIPAASVGELVGISDKSSFFRQFLNITGITPRDYRDQYGK